MYPDSPYLDIYKESWKYLVIKISWTFLENEDFSLFASYLLELKQKKIPLILVYGWWDQITKNYFQTTGKTRKRWDDGINITSKCLLDNGVIPAYNEIGEKLKNALWESNIHIFQKEDIFCKSLENAWEVWCVESFKKSFQEDKINIIPFVWVSCDDITKVLNINADDIVPEIVRFVKGEVSNILYLTGAWWLKNKDWKIVSFLTKKKLEKILHEWDESICFDGQMRKKLQSILDCINNGSSKATIVDMIGLKWELEGFWTGTMIVDLEKAKFKPLEKRELFDFIYKEKVGKGEWRERTKEEKDEIFQNYQVLEIKGTILWWYALMDNPSWDGKVLECFFAGKEGGWIGRLLWEQIKKNGIIYAYSKKWDFFKKLWFQEISWKYSLSWASLYKYSWG